MGGNAFDQTTIGSGASLTYDSTALRQTLSMLATTGATSAVASADWTTSVGSMSHVYVRFLFRRASASAVTQVLCRGRPTTSSQNFRITLDTDDTVTLRNSASSFLTKSVGTTNTTDTWMIRADITIGASVTGILYVHYDPLVATPDEILTVNNANFGTTNTIIVNWGLAIAVANSSVRLDDVALSNVSLPGPPAQNLGQAVELQTAQPVTRAKTRALVQALETNIAQSLARRKSRTLAQSVETDSAQPVTRRKSRTFAQAIETSTSQPLTRRKSRALGLSVEQSIAETFARLKSRTLGLPIEIDTSQSLIRRKTRSLQQAIENDSAQAIGRLKSRQLSLAIETSTAQSLTRSKRRILSQAVEVDLAQAVRLLKSRTLGLAIETDLAFPFGQVTIVQLGIAIEDNSALPLTLRKSRTLALAIENDLALAVSRLKRLNLGQAIEISLALPFEATPIIIVPVVAQVTFKGVSADWLAINPRSHLTVTSEGRVVAEDLTTEEIAERLRTYD